MIVPRSQTRFSPAFSHIVIKFSTSLGEILTETKKFEKSKFFEVITDRQFDCFVVTVVVSALSKAKPQ